MALNAIEQLELLEEGFTNLTKPLDDVILMEFYRVATNFIANQKDTEPGGIVNMPAEQYRSKCNRVAQTVQKREMNVERLSRLLMAKIGSSTTMTKAELQAATEAQILTFIGNQLPGILENLAGVEPREKTAYDSL